MDEMEIVKKSMNPPADCHRTIQGKVILPRADGFALEKQHFQMYYLSIYHHDSLEFFLTAEFSAPRVVLSIE